MKEHLNVLEMAAEGRLPCHIDHTSNISIDVVQELISAGYLKAIDVTTLSSVGAEYMQPKITLTGREYLEKLREKNERHQMETKKQGGKISDSVEGISSVTDAWEEIEKEYDVSKRAFAKKIRFVKDEFKRKVLFRDIEQAFLLAHHGFAKPSVILAGGVIEEMLRLYLADKGVALKNNNLDTYIKTCEEKGLLKAAIHKLADSIRQFRNIVHLEREITSKHSISKATAKGAVSSIFTIANDFES